MDVNELAMVGIFLALCIWFVFEIFVALGRGWWKCPVCDFRTRSEEEALGHQARHSQHKPFRES